MMTRTSLLLVVILTLGIGLRLSEYFSNPSLDVDEARTAERIANIPLREALWPQPAAFDRMQSYPVGFLAAVKFFRTVGGDHEMVLRLFPLLASILALILFYKVAAYFLREPWALLALTMLAVARDIIYFSATLKPYASDMCAALAAFLMVIRLRHEKIGRLQIGLFLLAGLVILYSSIPVVMVLFPLAALLMIESLMKKDMSRCLRVGGLAAVWAAGWLCYYYLSLRHFQQDTRLQTFWETSFLPVNQGIFSIFQWMVVVFKRIFGKFLQYPVALAALLFLLGFLRMGMVDRRRWAFLVLPVCAGMALSALRLYPFDGRTILFLFPVIIILVVYGLAALVEATSSVRKLVGGLTVGLLLFMPVLATVQQFLEPSGPEEIKAVLAFVQRHREPEDLILVYRGSVNAYEHYRRQYGIDRPYLPVASSNLEEVSAQLRAYSAGQRFWVVFTHVRHDHRGNERIFILERLRQYGRKVGELTVPVRPLSVVPTLENNLSASVYLFEKDING